MVVDDLYIQLPDSAKGRVIRFARQGSVPDSSTTDMYATMPVTW